jgi:hypothetical protein
MDWRNARGGPSTHELRAVAALTGQECSDEHLEATRQLLAAQAIEQLGTALRERFVATSGISAAEWERVRDRLVIIHDKMTGEMVSDLVYESLDEDDADGFDAESDAPPRTQFAEFNATLPAPRRFERLGTLEEPVGADVYCAPE